MLVEKLLDSDTKIFVAATLIYLMCLAVKKKLNTVGSVFLIKNDGK